MSQLLSFAGFELRYHLRRPVNYVFMAVMFFVGKYVFLVAIGVSDILIDLGAALLAPLSP